MENKEYSDTKVVINNNELSVNKKENYSNISCKNSTDNSTIQGHNKKSDNIKQLQHEILNTKKLSQIIVNNNNNKENIKNSNNKIEENMDVKTDKNTKDKNNTIENTECNKNKKFNGSLLEIKHKKKDDPLLFSQEGYLISPIEKVKVVDNFISINSLPTPSSTPVPLSDSSSTSSSPTLLPSNTVSPNPLEVSSNEDANKSEISSLQQKIQNELIKIYKDILPTKQSKQRRLLLLEKIQNIFDTEFPGKPIKAHLFGSSVNGLETVYCDVDICLTTPSKEDNYGLDRMDRIAIILEKYNMTEICTVQEAKVPICKFVDPETNLSCDINVNNTIALKNTMMVRTYALIDERAQQFLILIKHYAKRRMINDAKGGTLSSYCWVNMAINFLQLRQPPILPCLHELGKNNSEDERMVIDGVDCTFYHDLDYLKDFGRQNKESLAELFYGFFKLYGEEFDYKHNVVSVRKGKYISKHEKGWDLDNKKTKLRNNYFCVEEPFNPSRNLANSADHSSISGLKDEFLRALNALRQKGDVDRVFEQYRPFRRPFNPYPGSGFNSMNTSNYINNYSYNIAAAATNSLSNALYNGALYPVYIPTSNYTNYNQYAYPQPLYLVQPNNTMYSYNSGDEDNSGFYHNNEHYPDSSNNKYATHSNTSFKYNNGNKKKKKYSIGNNKKHQKMNSTDSNYSNFSNYSNNNYNNKNDHDNEPMSPNPNTRFGLEINNNGYYTSYPNPYIIGYDRFSNYNSTSTSGNISNGKINYSFSSPKPTITPLQYTSPILSPTSSFSSVLNGVNPNDSNVSDTFSTNSHYIVGNSFSSANTSLTENIFEIDDDFQRPQRILSSSPLYINGASDEIENENKNKNENENEKNENENSKDNSFSSTKNEYFHSLMNQSISEIKTINSKKTSSLATNFATPSTKNPISVSELEEKMKEDEHKKKENEHRNNNNNNNNSKNKNNNNNSKKNKNNQKLNQEKKNNQSTEILSSESITSVPVSSSISNTKSNNNTILSPSPIKSISNSSIATSSVRTKINSTGKIIPSGFDSIKYPSMLKINLLLNNKLNKDSNHDQLTTPNSIDDIKLKINSTSELDSSIEVNNKNKIKIKNNTNNNNNRNKNKNEDNKNKNNTSVNSESLDKEKSKKSKSKNKASSNNTNSNNLKSKLINTNTNTNMNTNTKTKPKTKPKTNANSNTNTNSNTDLLLKSINALLSPSVLTSTTRANSNIESSVPLSSSTESNPKRRERTSSSSSSKKSGRRSRTASLASESTVYSTDSSSSNKKEKFLEIELEKEMFKEKKKKENKENKENKKSKENKEDKENKEKENDNSSSSIESSTSPSPAPVRKTRKSRARKARDSIRELSKTAFEKQRTVNDILNIFKKETTDNEKNTSNPSPSSISYAKILTKNL